MEILFSKLGITDLWLKVIITFTICIIIGLVVQWIVFFVLKTFKMKKPSILKTQLLKHHKTSAQFLLPILFIYGLCGIFQISTFWHKVIEGFIIIIFSAILIAILNAVEEILKQKFVNKSSYKAKDRKAITQMRFVKSVSIVVIVTLAVATILWNIPTVKNIGTSILTSAGIYGIIAGVVAQKSIANFITDMQIAFKQPIKIDDEVVIKGVFGKVEDLTLTNVVVKTWDWRRLVLPLNYFNDHPFVKWTFNLTQLIGSVFLYVDYTFPVNALRKKFLDNIALHKLWDKKIAQLLVTNTDANSIAHCATLSKKNANKVWALVCEMREQLITFIQEKYTESLLKLRREPVLS
jgi:small-conductance mechanosensitive channel